MHRPAVVDEAGRHVVAVEADHRPLTVDGEQDASLLEALPDRRHPVGQTAGADPEHTAGLGVAAADALALHLVVAVGIVHRSAGEHVQTTGEHRGQRAPQHEDLQAFIAVAHEHHRGGIAHRHAVGVEVVPRHGCSSCGRLRGGVSVAVASMTGPPLGVRARMTWTLARNLLVARWAAK